MSEKITKLVANLLDGIHSVSTSETIVGEPRAAGDAMVIPVHRVKIAFGAGSATAGAHKGKVGGDTGGQGAGGAIELEPVAAIAVGKDGHAHVLTVEGDSSNTWTALLQEVPDLLGKIAHTMGDRVSYELKHRGVAGELESTTESAEAKKAD
ncbi:MAG TPA: spore germination protein GerW family protein [Polyangiaceae bacterium]|nr:spore germination protein GerW family protein [Polyangiaceae bacterium]HMR76759.1 spore germination protein GerW family protein [Polyangiaceae bacterium]